MKQSILGAIDVGSNAIRLLINDIDKESDSDDFKKVAFLRVPIRLGEDVFGKGYIDQEKHELLMEAFHGFAHIFKAYGIKKYRACATSAMREATNGKQIIDDIEKECGIKLDIISGWEEAELICQAGGLDVIEKRYKNFLYVDVGGGSTEIVVFYDGKKINLNSFELGTVRHLTRGSDEHEVERLRNWLSDVKEHYSPSVIIASGGNINKIHKLLDKRSKESIRQDELKELYTTLRDMDYDERIRRYKLKTYRADVIIPAMKIFLWVAKSAGIDDIYVPKVGLSDGIIHYLNSNNNK